ADPRAISVAASASWAADMVGLPEARIILSEAVIYLAAAPKSNSAYLAINAALSAIEKGDIQEIPQHLRPGGEGYRYPHDSPGHWVEQQYMETERQFYHPQDLGEERLLAKRLASKGDRHDPPYDQHDAAGDTRREPLPEDEGGEDRRKKGSD
ncbi:MAG TPA: hypothetical protein ENN89_04555, partial [Synergistetes bacterium]|nr:hypothetical protein [Synergistota bacterium]